jgi:hypothetical protein
VEFLSALAIKSLTGNPEAQLIVLDCRGDEFIGWTQPKHHHFTLEIVQVQESIGLIFAQPILESAGKPSVYFMLHFCDSKLVEWLFGNLDI